jgi:hypothetical protein
VIVSQGRSCERVKNRGVRAKCSRGSRSLGSVLVALWGSADGASVLKCHEPGAILCAYGVGNLLAHKTNRIDGILANGKALPGLPISENLIGTLRA